MFDRTADALVGVYRKLIALNKSVNDYTEPIARHGEEERAERGRILLSKFQEFEQEYFPNKIYIPKGTAEKIRVFNNTLHSIVLNFQMAQAVDTSRVKDPAIIEQRHQKLEELFAKAPDLLSALEDDFQKVLGFPIEEQKK